MSETNDIEHQLHTELVRLKKAIEYIEQTKQRVFEVQEANNSVLSKYDEVSASNTKLRNDIDVSYTEVKNEMVQIKETLQSTSSNFGSIEQAVTRHESLIKQAESTIIPLKNEISDYQTQFQQQIDNQVKGIEKSQRDIEEQAVIAHELLMKQSKSTIISLKNEIIEYQTQFHRQIDNQVKIIEKKQLDIEEQAAIRHELLIKQTESTIIPLKNEISDYQTQFHQQIEHRVKMIEKSHQDIEEQAVIRHELLLEQTKSIIISLKNAIIEYQNRFDKQIDNQVTMIEKSQRDVEEQAIIRHESLMEQTKSTIRSLRNEISEYQTQFHQQIDYQVKMIERNQRDIADLKPLIRIADETSKNNQKEIERLKNLKWYQKIFD